MLYRDKRKRRYRVGRLFTVLVGCVMLSACRTNTVGDTDSMGKEHKSPEYVTMLLENRYEDYVAVANAYVYLGMGYDIPDKTVEELEADIRAIPRVAPAVQDELVALMKDAVVRERQEQGETEESATEEALYADPQEEGGSNGEYISDTGEVFPCYDDYLAYIEGGVEETPYGGAEVMSNAEETPYDGFDVTPDADKTPYASAEVTTNAEETHYADANATDAAAEIGTGARLSRISVYSDRIIYIYGAGTSRLAWVELKIEDGLVVSICS